MGPEAAKEWVWYLVFGLIFTPRPGSYDPMIVRVRGNDV
jgi:hypothetical protein